MKFKKLTIKNIASLADVCIDFQGEQLSSPLFLICGPNGAGKTSILDGICLALFGKTPRKHSNSKDKFTPDPETDHLNKEINVDDPCLLMTRGKREAFAQLEFEALDGRVYTAKWSIEIPRTKTTIYHTLTNDKGKEFELNRTEIEKKIVELIGLTFDQFCKTTMLAQGEFANFLKSKPAERAEILEKITGTEIFSKVGRLIAQRYKEINDAILNRREVLGNLQLMTDEDKENMLKEMKQTEEEMQQLQKKIKALTTMHTWLNASQKLNEQKKQCEKDLQDATQVRAKLNNVAELITLWDATADVRNSIQNKLAKQKQLREEENKAPNFRQKFQTAVAHQMYLDDLHKELQKTIDDAKKVMAKHASHTATLQNAQAIAAKLDSVGTLNSEIEKKSQEKTQLEKELKVTGETLKKIATARTEAEEERNKQSALLQETTNKLNDANPDEVDSAFNGITQAEAAVKTFRTTWTNLMQKQQELTTCENELKESLYNMEQLQKQLEPLQKAHAEAENELKIRKDTFDNAIQIIGHLHVGDECPICHNIITQLESSDSYKSVIEPLQQKADATKKDIDDLDGKIKSLQAKTGQLRKDKPQKETNANDAKSQYATAFNELSYATASAHISLWTNEMPSKEDIESLSQQISKQQAEIAKAHKEISELRKSLTQVQKAQTNAQKVLDDANKNWEKANKDKTEKESDYKSCEKSIEELKRQVDTLWKEVATDTQEYGEWEMVQHQELAKRLRTDAKELEEATKRMTDAQSEQKAMEGEMRNIADQREKIEALAPSWNGLKVQPCQFTMREATKEWSNLWTDFSTWHNDVKNLRNEIEECKQKEDDFFATNTDKNRTEVEALSLKSPDDVKGWRNQVEEANRELSSKQGALQNVSTSIAQHEETKPQDMTEGDTEASLQQKIEAMSGENTALQDLNSKRKYALEQNEGNAKKYAELAQDIERRQAVLDAMQPLKERLGDTEGKRFRTLAQNFVLNELLHYANEHLRTLTGNRFRLEADEHNILVRDFYHGGARQTPSNLSAGETFMAALSLALALSSMSANTSAAADIVFIDEGFGSLDQEHLNLVLGMLNSIHASGRRVGIISHVGDMQQVIPTRIRVTPKGQNNISEVTIES